MNSKVITTEFLDKIYNLGNDILDKHMEEYVENGIDEKEAFDKTMREISEMLNSDLSPEDISKLYKMADELYKVKSDEDISDGNYYETMLKKVVKGWNDEQLKDYGNLR